MTGGLVHTCTLQKRARKKKFTYTGSTGTPAVGQTITGGTSLKTAVIDKTGTGYLIVKTLSGTFTTTETITVGTAPGYTFSATLSAQEDYRNQSGEYEYYWSNDQTSVACRFYYSGAKGGKGAIIHETGQLLDQPLKCALPASCTVDSLEYRVVNTVTGFAGTYDVITLYPLTGVAVIHHYEAVLKKVTT
jgi:hypothetical protein